MSKPTRSLVDQISKARQLEAARAKAYELTQHLDDAEQLEGIPLQAAAAALKRLEPRSSPQQQAAALKSEGQLKEVQP